MTEGSSDINGKVYGRGNRLLLMPKEKSKQYQRPKNTLMSTNVGINKCGFRRSPHLQAAMDRIEQRRQTDREKEIRWQEASRRRRNRQTTSFDSRGEDEQDLTDVLQVFSKYDNMLEHLVLKNMELMNLAEMKSKEIPDDETALTENVLNDLRTLRQFREQQLGDEPLRNFSELEDEYALSSPRTAGNPYLQFRRANESQGDEQASRQRTRKTPKSTRIRSSFSSRKRPVVGDEEIVDTFRPPRKTTAISASTPKSEDLLDNRVSRAKKIRELRERQRKRREAQAQNSEGSVDKAQKQQAPENRQQTDECEMCQFEDREGKTEEEQVQEPRQQAEAQKSKVVESSSNKKKKSEPRNRGNREQMETLRNELEELWCMCPVDLLEPRPLPPRNYSKIDSKIDPQTEESDNDSFGPSREARKLKKRLSNIYQQNKSLRSAQEDMRGEMLQLQQGYKQKHNKLKRKFLRNTAPAKQHQNESRESDRLTTPSEVYGQRDDSISYEVRDGVIVLDDIQDGADIPECAFLGVHNPEYRLELSAENNYMQQPIAPVTDDLYGEMDEGYIHQDYMQQPVMELPFSPEEQAHHSDAEWTYDHQGHGVVQSHSHNYNGGKDEDDTDDDDSMTYDSQSAYTIEHYPRRRDQVWNCAAEL